ncbi:unnamed protein product [Cylicocyclus nassatus]|uniref:RPGR-interacting protein 1 first C2 domain-containing protein n=1 Tax=Cylicocyclus nassatus TaxID=53992 RepID=A0AA36H6X5_CYLNA|nr:unnamed protein product [Cylicocyclus nassatus]
MELEENFHNAYQQLQAAQKKVNEQDKKITILNTRLRRSVMERKAKQDAYVEREKFEELERENQVLALKLKTVKHQLLTYTTPTARPATASAMTGRSTFRPQHTRRPPPTASTAAEKTERTDPNAENADPKRPTTARISEAALRDKASYIRLNRLVREKNSQVAELQYEIERLNGLLHDLRSQLETKTSSMRELESELRSIREHADDAHYLGKIELISKQLSVVEAENEVLKEANERLVKQSLSMEFDESMKEQIELKKQISVLEERLKEAEQKRAKTEQKLRKEKRAVKSLKERERMPKGAMLIQREQLKSEESVDEEAERHAKEKESSTRKRKKKKGENGDDILERLYRDVSAILETHDSYDDGIIEASGGPAEKLAKWKKMYASLYDELEKLRNMLLVQHDINQKQNLEISLLQEEMESIKVKYESKLKELRDKLVEKQKKILLLEEQIRSIAYGSQKPIPIKATGEKAEISTDLSIMFTGVSLTDEFVASLGACPAYFLSLEFFDFELQTTPILTKQTTVLDFTTIYNVVVSNLFVHYIETNGITIELYSPQGTNYTLLAAGVVNLKPLLQKGAKSRYVGELKLVSLDSGAVIANLKYELNSTEELTKSIGSYQAAEAAQKVLPIEIPLDEQSFEELTVMVHRCTGLEKLKKGEMEVCVIYEFFSFSPYFTNYATSSNTAEFNSKRSWMLPLEAVQNYLGETEISFFLFENRPQNREEKEGVLAMLSLPIAPLAENKRIKGSFMMTKEDGNDSGVYLDVTIMWKHGLHSTIAKPGSGTTSSKPETDTTQIKITPAPPVRRPQESVDIIKDSSSNDSNEDVFSPVSVRSPKIPSVTEIDHKEIGTSAREDIETISLKDSSRASNTPVADTGANEDKEDRKSSSSSVNSQTGTFDVERPSSRESAESVVSQTEKAEQADKESQKADNQAAKAREKMEKDKNEIRSLLGDLPPIAKPRLSKPPSEFTSLGRPKHESEESSSRSKTSSENDELRDRQRAVFFTDPLHKSIPPSETSSMSSPPPRPPVRLPAKGGRSAIRVTNVTQEDDSDSDESRTVSIFIDRIYVPEFSRLLHPSYDGVKVYVDWFFLDYPLEESRTPEAVLLPRVPDSPGVFAFRKEFQLSKRRVALLEQWVELGNRLDFTLITEGEDSEELAVAQLELSRTATDETTTIQFLDINGEHYADLDLVVSYPPQIFDCLKT